MPNPRTSVQCRCGWLSKKLALNFWVSCITNWVGSTFYWSTEYVFLHWLFLRFCSGHRIDGWFRSLRKHPIQASLWFGIFFISLDSHLAIVYSSICTVNIYTGRPGTCYACANRVMQKMESWKSVMKSGMWMLKRREKEIWVLLSSFLAVSLGS